MESKKQLVDSILESVREELSQFVEIEGKIESSLEYEEKVLELGRRFMRATIEKSAGKIPKSRNKKKDSDERRQA